MVLKDLTKESRSSFLLHWNSQDLARNLGTVRGKTNLLKPWASGWSIRALHSVGEALLDKDTSWFFQRPED